METICCQPTETFSTSPYKSTVQLEKQKHPDNPQKEFFSSDGSQDDESEESDEESEESESEENEFIFDTTDNHCPPEKLRKGIKDKMNSKEYIDAMKSLKAQMEKKCPEKFKR